MRTAFLATTLLALWAVSAQAAAKDPKIEALLKAAELQYDTDDDGDYRLVIEWDDDKRSQLVYVSGALETLGEGNSSTEVYTVFSPAYVLGQSELEGDRARSLLENSAKTKMGAWELMGKTVYFTIKLPGGMRPEQFHEMVVVAASTADDMELELTPGKDDL